MKSPYRVPTVEEMGRITRDMEEIDNDTIYVQWSDDGQHIRKYSRNPFEGAETFSRHQSGRTGAGEALLVAAIGLQKDLLDRAEWDDDCKVVCAGSGAWRRFCDAIDAAGGDQ